MHLSWPLKAYIAATVALGIVAGAWSLSLFPVPHAPGKLALAAAFAVLVGLAGAYPIPLSPKLKAKVTTAAVFAALLVLQPSLAFLAVTAGVGASEALLRRPWPQVAFNAAMTSLYVVAAGLAFHTLSPAGLSAITGQTVAGMVAVAAIMYTANRVAVSIATGLQLRKNPFPLWRQAWKEDLVQECALLAFGLLAALAIDKGPWAIALLVVPVAIVYRSFVQIVELNRTVQEQMNQLKATEAQLVQAAKMAAIGTLATGVAHQINNPIFAIQGRAELLLSGAESHLKSAKARQYVNVIYEMSDRVSKIVKAMLTSARPSEDGEWSADVHEALDNVLVLLESRIKKGSIQVVREYAERLPLVRGSSTEIQEIFMNLAVNSCDAMPHGGTLKLISRASDSHIHVEVTDTGEGIPQENLSQVFEPFFTTKEAGKGMGLGLYVVREVVQKQGGSVSVKSDLGRGSTFLVTLPVAPRESDSESAMVMTASGNGSRPLERL